MSDRLFYVLTHWSKEPALKNKPKSSEFVFASYCTREGRGGITRVKSSLSPIELIDEFMTFNFRKNFTFNKQQLEKAQEFLKLNDEEMKKVTYEIPVSKNGKVVPMETEEVENELEQLAINFSTISDIFIDFKSNSNKYPNLHYLYDNAIDIYQKNYYEKKIIDFFNNHLY